MIDKQPLGGTCALRGCDPKKVLVSVAATVDAARALSGKGIRPNGLAINWPELMQFKRTFTDPVPATRKKALAEAGIVTLEGVARFTGLSQLSVNDERLDAMRAIVIASGARPADLPIEGREHLVTSDQFLELPELPPSLAFVGGGYISFEFAHIAARAGARVTILHRRHRALAQFEPEQADQLVARTRAAGIDVTLGAEVVAIDRVGTRFRLAFHREHGVNHLDADAVVHGAGRIPDIEDLALDTAGVQFSRAGVHVNQYLQSISNSMVWAAGDCAATGAPRLTPIATYEGRIVAANLLEGRRTTADYRIIPSVVFTMPPLARVGTSEADARAKYPELIVKRQDTSHWFSSRCVSEAFSSVKVLIDKRTDQIVGAHVLGPHADETINIFALAMRAGCATADLQQMLWAYPTHGSDTPSMV
jgi:glutathione reductase (NADPH)